MFENSSAGQKRTTALSFEFVIILNFGHNGGGKVKNYFKGQ